MGHKVPSLMELVRAQGEGWRAFIGGAERGESWASPGVSVGIAGEASPQVNLVFAYGPEGVGDGIASAAAALRRRSLPGGVYAASPVAVEAAEAAAAAGFQRTGHLSFMCVHASDVVRADGGGHETTRVTGVEGVLVAGGILADAFGLPGEWCRRLLGAGFASRTDAAAFLALHDGRPVAMAGSTQIGDVAGIHAVGTRLTHRRRGAGTAAVSAAIDHHLAAGARWFALYSSPATEPFYAGLGFVAVDHAGAWVLRPAS